MVSFRSRRLAETLPAPIKPAGVRRRPVLNRVLHRLALCGSLLVSLLSGGCSEPDSDSDDPRDESCAPATLSVVRDEYWPAGGHALTLRLQDDAGEPWRGDVESCLEIEAVESDDLNLAHLAAMMHRPLQQRHP